MAPVTIADDPDIRVRKSARRKRSLVQHAIRAKPQIRLGRFIAVRLQVQRAASLIPKEA